MNHTAQPGVGEGGGVAVVKGLNCAGKRTSRVLLEFHVCCSRHDFSAKKVVFRPESES